MDWHWWENTSHETKHYLSIPTLFPGHEYGTDIEIKSVLNVHVRSWTSSRYMVGGKKVLQPLAHVTKQPPNDRRLQHHRHNFATLHWNNWLKVAMIKLWCWWYDILWNDEKLYVEMGVGRRCICVWYWLADRYMIDWNLDLNHYAWSSLAWQMCTKMA
jgi:hypothetical protein